MGPRAGWIGAENLAPTGIRSPDRPVRSQSLYRLRYRAHQLSMDTYSIQKLKKRKKLYNLQRKPYVSLSDCYVRRFAIF